MNIYKHYSDSDMSNAAMVEELIKVNPDSLEPSVWKDTTR